MKFLRRLLRSFYPARCPYCGKVTTPFEEGCKNCVSQNPGQSEAFWIYHPYLGNDNIELICCSAWPYWDKPKAAVLRFKFHGRREYAEAFGLSMARSVKKTFPPLHSTWL
ncbi:MAG: ComF family protein [[Clostridium] leptum]